MSSYILCDNALRYNTKQIILVLYTAQYIRFLGIIELNVNQVSNNAWSINLYIVNDKFEKIMKFK